MVLQGDATRYSALVAILQWVSAVAILVLMGLGVLAVRASSEASTDALLRIHVPVGILVLAPTCERLLRRLFDQRPADVAGLPWQALTAKATHGLLYGIQLLMGVSEIALLVASRAGSILFEGNPGPLPSFSIFGPMAGHVFGTFTLVALSILHIGAALHHQFRRRDGLLLRMTVAFDRR